jgi:hypothetical protein
MIGRKRGEEQRQHGKRHDPVERARHEPMARDVRRQAGALTLHAIDFFRRTLPMLGEQHVAAMRQQKQQPADQRRPEQAP